MTRILTWNIQDLTMNSLMPTDLTNDPLRMRERLITETVQRLNPDIFVVIEVETGGNGERGTVITDTSGGPAVLLILRNLRQLNVNWCLVPPLVLGAADRGTKEGIAVFFRNDVVNFAGPFQVGEAVRPSKKRKRDIIQAGFSLGGPADTYLAPWDTALPNTAPTGNPIGNNLNQNQLAGRCKWETDLFPQAIHRPPYQTDFREVGGAGRTIEIFSVHLPSDSRLAAQAVQRIAGLNALTTAPGGTTVRVLTGDFNINYLNPNKVGGYNPLINAPVSLSPSITTVPTHYAAVNNATVQGANPYYGYMSQGSFRNPPPLPDGTSPRKLLDNFFVSGGAVAGTVANHVMGTGGVQRSMLFSIQGIVNNTNLTTDLARNTLFRAYPNFQHVRDTSDHLPIYIDI